ncbi:MAG: helix-turn-helix domain-containing protein [Acidovorax sp.]
MVHPFQHQSDLAALRAQDPDFAGTLAKGLLILQAFVVKDPRPYANSELAALLGMPRPTVSRLCRTLLALGYLDHDERTDRYYIGPAAVALGYPYIASIALRAQARPAMQALANQVRGAVSIGVAVGLDLIFVETCAWQRGTLARPDQGTVRSIAEMAMGRAWLYAQDEATRRDVLQQITTQRPEEMARCTAGIKESLANQARLGFATNMGDAGYGAFGVGLCSRLRHGPRSLIFNCAVPFTRMRPKDLVDNVGPRLVELVHTIERTAIPGSFGDVNL